MSLTRTNNDNLEAELIAACDEAAKFETEAETNLTAVRISGTQRRYGIAVMDATLHVSGPGTRRRH